MVWHDPLLKIYVWVSTWLTSEFDSKDILVLVGFSDTSYQNAGSFFKSSCFFVCVSHFGVCFLSPIAVSAAQVGQNRKFYSERFAKTQFCRFVFCIVNFLEINSFVCDFHPFSIYFHFPQVFWKASPVVLKTFVPLCLAHVTSFMSFCSNLIDWLEVRETRVKVRKERNNVVEHEFSKYF